MQDESIQSQGGKARAESLTKLELKTIAQKAAAARWDIPKATHEGEIKLGSSFIPCAVLNNKEGTRVLTQQGFLEALGRAGKAKGGTGSTVDGVVPFLAADNLKPFITKDLDESTRPIKFRTLKGATAFGFRADLLPKVCEVYLRAREEKALSHTQAHLAKKAEILVRALANVAITALVDEATGFQYERARTALADILDAFIAKELRAWATTFPLEFYRHIFRLNNWPFDPKNMKKPSVVGHYTNNIVYKRLAPGVLKELRDKNPVIEGRRKHKHFQWLSGDIGHPKLLAHLEGVKILMRDSDTWDELIAKLDRHYPIVETTDLGFEIEVRGK